VTVNNTTGVTPNPHLPHPLDRVVKEEDDVNEEKPTHVPLFHCKRK
jgi:hypothetical protein